MPYNVLIHITGEEAVLAEIDELPAPNDVMIRVSHPRRLDGKDLPYISESVVTVFWPTSRITFIEVMPTREEESIIGFVRE